MNEFDRDFDRRKLASQVRNIYIEGALKKVEKSNLLDLGDLVSTCDAKVKDLLDRTGSSKN